QYLGMIVLVGVSLVAALISLVMPASYVGLLGLVPIVIGVKRLCALRRGSDKDDTARRPAGFGNVLAVAGVTIANGGHNIGFYTPVFATSSAKELGLFTGVFVVMTALWLSAGYYLVNHPSLGAPIRRYQHVAVPLVLIAIGIMVLYDADTLFLLS